MPPSLTYALVLLGAGLRIVAGQDTSPGGPVHEGQPDNCNGWHTVVSGDTCKSVPKQYGITFKQFLKWNPAVSEDCVENFWLESAYCVSVGPRASSSTTKEPGSTTTTSSVSSSTSAPITTSQNTTYSTQHPVTDWNLTATTVDYEWPPAKTMAGQPDLCNWWHRVLPGDTCQSVVNRFGLITLNQFLDWNPGVEDDCDELLADYWVCAGTQNANPNTDLVWQTEQPEFTPPPSPTEHSLTTFPPANSSFSPTPSHGPMPTDCSVFHQAEADQNCNDIVQLYGYLSQKQFMEWNPVLDGNCNGLWLDTWYCVGAFEDSSLPLPSHITTSPQSGTIPTGHPSDCERWYQAYEEDTCVGIASIFGSFNDTDFISWNPTVYSDCSGIIDKAWYCIGREDTPTTRTDGAPTPTEAPEKMPTQSGIATGCSSFWLVSPDDDCSGIARSAGISVNDLYKWNEVLIAPQCSGLEPDYYICIGVGADATTTSGGGSTTARPTSTSTTTEANESSTSTTSRPTTTTGGSSPVETPSPVRQDMAEDCVRFYLMQSGDLCYSMADAAGISLSQFYEWNPAVGDDCGNLWPDYYYCIGVSGPATTITNGMPVPT